MEKARVGFVAEALGFAFAQYLLAVKRLNRVIIEPAPLETSVGAHHPGIVAMWHGQHIMVPFARSKNATEVSTMVSRHSDADAQASALKWLGYTPVRGSGARGDRIREKGGAQALIRLRQRLDAGASVAMTADVPKVARVAGLGIVTLARISGRPIVPIAVAASRRIDFKSWDRASIGLPFGRVAIVVGETLTVDAGAGEAEMETARLAVQDRLDAAHARAYALVGAKDPGADLRKP